MTSTGVLPEVSSGLSSAQRFAVIHLNGADRSIHFMDMGYQHLASPLLKPL